jgi:hypothetical protein
VSANVVTATSLVSASSRVLSAGAPDEAILLDPVASRYYGLDDVGARVWALLEEPRRVTEIRDALVAEYDVDPEVALEDVTTLLRELLAAGLVDVADESAS